MSGKPLTLYALAAHALGDFPLQTDNMAANKLDDPGIRAKHVATYTLGFLPVALATDWDRKGVAVFLLSVAGSHFMIDSRRWNENVPIWYDQALHVIALAVAMVLGRRVSGE